MKELFYGNGLFKGEMRELGDGSAKNIVIFCVIIAFFGCVLIGVLFMTLFSDNPPPQPQGGFGTCNANLSAEGRKMFAGKEDLFPKYHNAAEKFGVPWHILASVHVQETGLGRTTTDQDTKERQAQTSSTNAIGPMQFMDRTWVGWNKNILTEFPGADQTPFWGVGDLNDKYQKQIMNPKTIEKYGGYGLDANNDGLANPWDEEDAILSAANYLKNLADNNGKDWKKAAASYSGQTQGYDSEVVKRAEKIADNATVSCTGGWSDEVSKNLKNFNMGEAPVKIKEMINRGLAEFNNIDYVMGGNTPPKTGQRGVLDCSSFVKWMYSEYLGINLPRTAVTQQQSNLGYSVDKNAMKPGDLIFLQNTYTAGVSHVGIYMGDNKYLNASSSSSDMEITDINSSYIKKHWHSVKRYYKEGPNPSPGPAPKAPTD